MIEDRRQRTRAKRILLGSVTYALWLAIDVYLYNMGLLRVGPLWLLSYFILIVLGNAAFLMAVIRGWNLRFADPGMTLPQIAMGLFWGMVLLAEATPETHGGLLLLFVTSFFFGVFRLTTRQFLGLTALTAAAYGGIIIAEWHNLTPEMRRIEVSQWIFLSLVLFWMSFMGGYVARLRANLRNAMRKIERLANQDDLTGTYNRRSITTALSAAIHYARQSGSPLSVCMLDLDHFKNVNDRHGHLVGDEVLRQFVTRVESCLRTADHVQATPGGHDEPLGRFGGEEFLVILPGTDLEGARHAAERIRRVISDNPFDTSDGEICVTVSIGITSFRSSDSADDLLGRCDDALYQSKHAGRDCVTASTEPVTA